MSWASLNWSCFPWTVSWLVLHFNYQAYGRCRIAVQEKAGICSAAYFAFGRVYIGRKPLPISMLSSVSHARAMFLADQGRFLPDLHGSKGGVWGVLSYGYQPRGGHWVLVSANASAVASSKGANPFHSCVVMHQSESLLFVFEILFQHQQYNIPGSPAFSQPTVLVIPFLPHNAKQPLILFHAAWEETGALRLILILVMNLLLCNSSFPGRLVGLQFLVLINFSEEFRVLWPEHVSAFAVA